MADTIFYNGDVITVEGKPSTWDAEAVVVKEGKIAYVGDKEEAMKHKTPSTVLVDLKGDTLLPGFIEPHSHPVNTGLARSIEVDVSGYNDGETLTCETAWAKIKASIAESPDGGWVRVHGFNSMLVPGMVLPTLKEADAMAPNCNFVILLQGDHAMMANTMALKSAKVDKHHTQVPGGYYGTDENGELNGLCYDVGALFKVLLSAPDISPETGLQYLRETLNTYSQNGFTTVCDMLILQGFPNIVKHVRELVASPSCPVRIVAYMDEICMKQGIENPVRLDPDGGNFHHVGVKFFADGSPYSGTMAVKEPFLETDITRSLEFKPYPNYGYLIHAHEDLHRMILEGHKKGFQVAVHSQGERAVDQTLDVYESILKTHPKDDHRFRLEHCALITKDQLLRAKHLGVYVSFFPIHVYFYGRALRDSILGPERAARLMPFKTALDLGHEMSAHSDTPCAPLGIMRVLKTIVTRSVKAPATDEEDFQTTPEQLGPSECIPIDEALKCVTINAAKQCFHENLIGSIAPWKLADFTRLSANPRKVDPLQLDKIKIVQVYRNGQEAKLFQV